MPLNIRQPLLLLVTASIWGCSFIAQSVGMESIGPFSFTTARMLLAVLVLGPLVWLIRLDLYKNRPQEYARRRLRTYRKQWVLGSLTCGLLLLIGEVLQQYGFVHHTGVGKAGFITALYIVIVPILGLFLGQRLTWNVVVAVVVALIGLRYLCLPDFSTPLSTGDLYMIVSAFVFSLHILAIGRFVLEVNPIELALGQFLFGSIMASVGMVILEYPSWAGFKAALIPLLWAGLISNGIAYTLQMVGQRGMNETVASLILSLESVIAVVAGWLILNQRLTTSEFIGCVIMLVAIVLAQLPLGRRSSS